MVAISPFGRRTDRVAGSTNLGFSRTLPQIVPERNATPGITPRFTILVMEDDATVRLVVRPG